MTGSKFEIFGGRILPDPPYKACALGTRDNAPPPPPVTKNLATTPLPGTQAHNRLREAKMRINHKFDKKVKIQFLK